MNCLEDERLVELLDLGGLGATRPEERAHLETCDTCRDTWASVAVAGELLTAARPKALARFSRMVPFTAAAAALLAIFGVILLRRTPLPISLPVRDPLVLFTEGTPAESQGARQALLERGRKALPGLVAARPKLKGSARFQALQDLIWDIKAGAAAQDPADLAIFRKLETMKIDLAFENTKLEDILQFVRDFSGVNMILDPHVNDGVVDRFHVQNASLRTSLEIACAVKDLDFDLRYGVLYFDEPLRLWSTDPKVGTPPASSWAKPSLTLEESEVAQKLRAIPVTFDAQNVSLRSAAEFLLETTAVKITVDPAVPEGAITTKFQHLSLAHVLELLTLPYGWDFRIEGTGVVIFVPKK